MTELNPDTPPEEFGRPRKEFNWQEFDSMCGLGASLDYCCERLLIGWGEPVTQYAIKATRMLVDRRIKERFECTFVEYRDKRMENTKLKVFQKQLQVAMNGNAVMLIWLGKNLLKQTDKMEVDQTVTVSQDTTEKIKARAEKIDAMLAEVTQGPISLPKGLLPDSEE